MENITVHSYYESYLITVENFEALICEISEHFCNPFSEFLRLND